jgi:ADP-ribose pyrophosphatase YjhB (NUDIX family)
MGLGWDDSYLGQLRARAGDDQILIAIGACCVVRDDDGQVLLVKREDNGLWGLPAGTMELNETVRECALRGLTEETGLIAHSVTPFGLYSRLSDWGPNLYGHLYHHVTLACLIDLYEGKLIRETDETTDAAFHPPGALPDELMPSVVQALRDLEAFDAGGPFIFE